MSEPIHKQVEAVVAQWNRDAAAARNREQQYQAHSSPTVPDGRFGMDGYLACGAICGGLYGGIAGGWLGAVLGAATGAILVAVVLGPFWFLYRKYRGWGYSDEERANPFSSFSSLRLPRRRRLSTPMSLAFWALLGAALGAWFGVWFTAAIDLAEESARGALYFGSAGLVAGLCLRLITLAFRKKVVQG